MSNEKKGSGALRLLRVGENIRHSLSNFIARGDMTSPLLKGMAVTISEVRVARDLRTATVFYMPLGGRELDKALQGLKDGAPEMRHHLSKTVRMKYIPKLTFKLDESFDEATHINNLLQDPKVQRDLNTPDTPEDET